MTLALHQPLQLWQQNHAFLFLQSDSDNDLGGGAGAMWKLQLDCSNKKYDCCEDFLFAKFARTIAQRFVGKRPIFV